MFSITGQVGGRTVDMQTHDEPHPDEVEAWYLAVTFGTPEFVSRFCPDGVLWLGTGGGDFDEHPSNGQPRKQDVCCAVLVARALGIESKPGVAHVLKYVLREDLRGSSNAYELGPIAKLAYRLPDTSAESVVRWMLDGLEAKHQERKRRGDFTIQAIAAAMADQQKSFTEEWLELGLRAKRHAQEVFEEAGEIYRAADKEELANPNGPPLIMVKARTDNWQFARVARSNGAAIVVQQQPSGHMQIFTDHKFQLDLDEVAHMLNLAEQIRAGQRPMVNVQQLRVEGRIPGGRWYYHKPMRALFNGSHTTGDNIPPTGLPINTVGRIIKAGIRA